MKLEFTGNLSLRDADKDRYQAIYATQLYGTFFGVFAKFECYKNTSKVKKIHFIGINFKGEKTLQICKKSKRGKEIRCDEAPEWVEMKKEQNQEDQKQGNNGSKMFKMKLWIQADVSDAPPKLEKLHLDLRKFKGKDYTFNSDDYIRLDRELVPMNTVNRASRRDKAFVKGNFDSEFYVRDGLFVKSKEVNGNNIRFEQGDIIVNDDFVKDDELEINWPTIRCTPGIHKVFV